MNKGGLGRLVTPFAITQMVLLAAIGCALWLAYSPWRWERTKENLRTRFPAVRRIGPDGLDEWFGKPSGSTPVLIDVRPQADYDFSHLKGALRMAVSDTPASLGFPETTQESLIVYDAVGEDAFAVAASLIQRGYARVQVLEGGIFEWANQGRPLDGRAGATGKVKPGHPKFAGLLNHRATAP